MNDLQKILNESKDLGLVNTSECVTEDGVLESVQLIDNRGPDWKVIFEITPEKCNVIELNYDRACIEQSNETYPTFEEALSVASEWC